MNRTLAIAVGVLALALPVVAHAQPTSTKLSQTVAYGDLNLDSRAGMAAMKRRLRSAAANICLQATGNGADLSTNTAYSHCVTRSVDHAMRRLHDQTGAKLIDVEAGGDLAMR